MAFGVMCMFLVAYVVYVRTGGADGVTDSSLADGTSRRIVHASIADAVHRASFRCRPRVWADRVSRNGCRTSVVYYIGTRIFVRPSKADLDY